MIKFSLMVLKSGWEDDPYLRKLITEFTLWRIWPKNISYYYF